MTHLWEMDTHWFEKTENQHTHTTFAYKSWKDFQDCKPYKFWKPYIVSSWSWKHIQDENASIKKELKLTDKDNSFMDCQMILRVNPSDYDKKINSFQNNVSEKEMLQIVFISPDRFTGMHRVEMFIHREDEEKVRAWLKNHMPSLWKL